MIHREMLIDGHFVGGECDQAVGKSLIRSPYDNRIIGTAAEGDHKELQTAIDCAHRAFQSWRHSPRRDRQKLLRTIASLVQERRQELVEILTDEVGKPVVWSRGEVDRLGLTFELAADALADFGLDAIPADLDARGDGHRILIERFPLGVIFGIVPYNWPFNLAAHKLAPALATGNTIVLKTSHQAPLSTLTLARLIHEAGCPDGVINAVNCSAQATEMALADPLIKMISFTGSPAVGWKLKGLFPEKRVALELGGDASAIVCADADLEWTTKRLVAGGYGYAGQICISIQHVLVHESLYDEAKAQLIRQTNDCPFGDPRKEETVCGPLITSEAADRVMSWIEEAVKMGATVLAGGTREGNVVRPTLIEGVPEGAKLSCREVFGPVMTLFSYKTEEEAFARVNSSEYGIQAGVFTHDMRIAEKAFQELEVGGVIINDYPTLRFDSMPYGGVKRSGFGREGVRYAMEEMTEPKAMVLRTL